MTDPRKPGKYERAQGDGLELQVEEIADLEPPAGTGDDVPGGSVPTATGGTFCEVPPGC